MGHVCRQPKLTASLPMCLLPGEEELWTAGLDARKGLDVRPQCMPWLQEQGSL